MTIDELKEVLTAIFTEYFPNTPIVWAEQKKLVKPSRDFITLKLRNFERPKHQITNTENGVPIGYYAVKTQLTVQLFTHGATKTVTSGDGTKCKVSVNTALNDLMDFDNFLRSEYGDELQDKYDVFLDAEGMAQDVSEVVDTNYEYRAYQEYTVTFTATTEGAAGISRENWKPTASGGGTKELADKAIDDIDGSTIVIEETD